MSSALQPLQSITRSLPAAIREPLIALIGKECYTSLVWNLDVSDTVCIKYSISKGLGLGLVAGGGIVKIPQIVKIIRSGSARGLSLSSYLLDTAGLLITVAYNARQSYPFSTYGENTFLSVQNFIIVLLIIAYSYGAGKTARGAAFTAVSAGAVYSLFTPSITPISVLRTLIAAVTPLSLASKIPQIATIFRDGSTGQLSAFLVFSSLAGTLGRVFTTMTETGDSTLWWSYVFASALNGVLALQMLMYWNKSGHDTSGKNKIPLSSKSPSYARIAAEKPALPNHENATVPVQGTSVPSPAASKPQQQAATPNRTNANRSTPRVGSAKYTRKAE